MPTTSVVIIIIIAAVIVVGVAAWQRCKFYFGRNYRLIVLVSGLVLEVGAIASVVRHK